MISTLSQTSRRNQYVEVINGSGPVVLAAPHGAKRIPFAAVRPGLWKTKHDIKTDLLVKELCRESEASSYPFSAVIALLHRAYIDLNREPPGGDGDRSAYWHAYHREIDTLLEECVAGWGAVLFIDIHGCKNSNKERGKSGNPLENAVYLGTRYGRCVPEMFSSAYGRFQESLSDAGYNMYPRSGYDEYPPFQGGFSVVSHFSRLSQEGKPCVAIQIEVPRTIRGRTRLRSEFASVLQGALTSLAGEMIIVSASKP